MSRRRLVGLFQSVWLHGGSYLLKMQKGERQTKRTMWFRGQNVPILYSSTRKDIFGSEDWIARGTIQKIGTTIFATVFFCGSNSLFFARRFTLAQQSEIGGGFVGSNS